VIHFSTAKVGKILLVKVSHQMKVPVKMNLLQSCQMQFLSHMQCTVDYLCMGYPVCILSVPNCKLSKTKDKGGNNMI